MKKNRPEMTMGEWREMRDEFESAGLLQYETPRELLDRWKTLIENGEGWRLTTNGISIAKYGR